MVGRTRGWKERKAKLLGLDAPLKIDQRVINFTIEFDTPTHEYDQDQNGDVKALTPGANGSGSDNR